MAIEIQRLERHIMGKHIQVSSIDIVYPNLASGRWWHNAFIVDIVYYSHRHHSALPYQLS